MTMSLKQQLIDIVKDESRVSTNETVLQQHGEGLAYHEWKKPDVVVYPTHKEEVQAIVRFANECNIPITPIGAGSSLEGQIIPQRGGISMDFAMMNRILHKSLEDFIVVVQPGVTREQLNEHLRHTGLFFPVDPGVDATIGGMAANNASGTNSVKYGVMRDQVLSLEVVLADGRLIQTGSRALKTASGYSLKDLFIGSEGTLGLFTEITLRLHGIPEQTMLARACFPTLDDAGETALELLNSGIPLGKIELVDQLTIEAVNSYLDVNIPVKYSLFIECSGATTEVTEQMKQIETIIHASEAESFDYEVDLGEKSTLWDARHQAGMAILAANPGHKFMSTDVSVPLSYLPKAIRHARQRVEEKGMEAAIFGHVGDGNFHVVIGFDPEDENSIEVALSLNEDIVHYALRVGGTATGEHGIGTGKIHFMEKEHGESFTVMHEVKRHFDPKSILNPGIIFPHEE